MVKKLKKQKRVNKIKAKKIAKAQHKVKLKAKVVVKSVVKVKQKNGDDEKEPRTRSTRSKREAAANIYPQDQVATALEELSGNEFANSYLKKNVSKRALDVLNRLVAPKTDEALAQELNMKINAVRRILNMMQGFGITNYYIAKNVNGWLSFAWYINISKLPPFFEYVNSVENKTPEISNDCNDYFMCNTCYEGNKLIFTFDAAFEENFKCSSCGKNLAMMDRKEATELIITSAKQAAAQI